MNVIVAPGFYRKLKTIYNYICFELFAPNAANNLFKKVINEIYKLENSPRIHMKVEQQNDLEYRRMIINNYIILYMIDESKKEVYITNIFYSKSNYRTKL